MIWIPGWTIRYCTLTFGGQLIIRQVLKVDFGLIEWGEADAVFTPFLLNKTAEYNILQYKWVIH